MPAHRYKAKILTGIAIITLIGATLYPSDLVDHYAVSKNGRFDPVVQITETYGRHTNTLLPLALAVVLRDWNGLWQIAWVAVGTSVATHGQKRLLNGVVIGDTRLGQRPLSADRKHNMPSGHSSAAAAGAWFTMRRYSMWFGLFVLPVLLLTMYARYRLDAHTLSATVAGAITGLLVTALFARHTPRFRRKCSAWAAKCLFKPPASHRARHHKARAAPRYTDL